MWHGLVSDEQSAFEAEAQRHTATVVGFDDADYLLTVTVNGETHEVVDAYEAEPGQQVEVWLLDGEIQLVDAPPRGTTCRTHRRHGSSSPAGPGARRGG